MHAFLIIGAPGESISAKVAKLSKELKVKTLEFPLVKIEDTRALNSFLRLKITSPTAIVINSIDKATSEAANAFLKDLEEPQEGLFYFLSAESAHKVLPTIVSRCQIIKTAGGKETQASVQVSKFIEMSIGEKLGYTDQIKDRNEAKAFVRDLINYLHLSLHKGNNNFSLMADNLEISQKTLTNLDANGNVTLQLTNLAINLK